MKKYIFILFSVLLFSSCSRSEITENTLEGINLPEELKGLKVYSISYGKLGRIKVATLNNEINSITYPQGKTQQTMLLINSNKNNIIKIKEIISENDSIIVCRK